MYLVQNHSRVFFVCLFLGLVSYFTGMIKFRLSGLRPRCTLFGSCVKADQKGTIKKEINTVCDNARSAPERDWAGEEGGN